MEIEKCCGQDAIGDETIEWPTNELCSVKIIIKCIQEWPSPENFITTKVFHFIKWRKNNHWIIIGLIIGYVQWEKYLNNFCGNKWKIFVEKIEMLQSSQFRFRSKMSCTDATKTVTEFMRAEVDKKKHSNKLVVITLRKLLIRLIMKYFWIKYKNLDSGGGRPRNSQVLFKRQSSICQFL